MIDGFIRVAAASPQIRVADPAFNASVIIDAVRESASQSASLVVLPELCVVGRTCGDLFWQRALLDAAEQALLEIAAETSALTIMAVVGLPIRVGGKLYDCAAVLHGGRVLALIPKTNLPAHDARYFSSADASYAVSLGGQTVPFGTGFLLRCKEYPELTIAAEVGEDLYLPDAPSGRYTVSGAMIICNPAADFDHIGAASARRAMVKAQSTRTMSAYLLAGAGAGESTTDRVYGGHCIITENGDLLAEHPPFGGADIIYADLDLEHLACARRCVPSHANEGLHHAQTIEFSMQPPALDLRHRVVNPTPFLPEDPAVCDAILTMQAAGLTQRLEQTGVKTVLLGLSGGLDSTLALLAAVRCFDRMNLPRKNIAAVLMPGFGTSGRTRGNAAELARAFGVTTHEIDIRAAVAQHLSDIGHDGAHDTAFENAQARERTQVLMDLANMRSGLVLGTGDLSELALGWTTFGGDHLSMYGVNASIPKTLVRRVIEYTAAHCGDAALPKVLADILSTPVSPELLPPGSDGGITQETESILGPYELHDFFLYHMLVWGSSPAKIYRLAQKAFAGRYEAKEILRCLREFYRRFFANQFKRSCLPDGPGVGILSLSPRGGIQMPSDACAALWMNEIDSL